MDLNGHNVPIVGQRRILVHCPKGHLDELPGQPFLMLLPSARHPGQAEAVICCRICMLRWLATEMTARVVTDPDEAEGLLRAARLQAAALLDGDGGGDAA